MILDVFTFGIVKDEPEKAHLNVTFFPATQIMIQNHVQDRKRTHYQVAYLLEVSLQMFVDKPINNMQYNSPTVQSNYHPLMSAE